jgi:hypothetical protein
LKPITSKCTGYNFIACVLAAQAQKTLYRFVILHHQLPTDEHWDVMLETESALTTWSIPPQCLSGSSFVCPASLLQPHRKDYLDYEGEISGNRGQVSRIDAGIYEQTSPEKFILHGTFFYGKLTIKNGTMAFEQNEYQSPNRRK